MAHFGKLLLVIGLSLAASGLLLIVLERFGFLGLGRLPGDLVWKRKSTTVYFPWVTSLVVSVVLTVLLNLFLRRK
jgi:hypothetical protein